MVNIIKGVISAGGYKLADIQHKIKKMFILGDLTEDQMDELLAMASGGVSADAERPEVLAMIQTLAAEIEALKTRVKALEGAEDDPDEPGEDTSPEWKPWDGISKDYQMGAVVSHNGDLWESVYNGQNVWEPNEANDILWRKHHK